MKEKAKESVNSIYGTYVHSFSNDTENEHIGVKINLIRAVLDNAPSKIKEISNRLQEIEVEKEKLQVELVAYEDLLGAAKKHQNNR